MSARLWLAYCTQGLFVVVVFVMVTDGSSMLGLVAFIIGAFGCVMVIGCMVDFTIIMVAVVDVCVIIVVRFMVAAFGGGCGLLAILRLA